MGNICCPPQEEESPLLNSGRVGVRSGTLSSPADGTVATQPSYTQPSQSARRYQPSKHKDFETSIEMIGTVNLQTIPIQTMNKTFQDLSRLYNEVVENFRSLETEIHRFKEFFIEETNGIPVLEDCVKHLMIRIGNAKIKVDRKGKNFLEVTYDKQEVSRACTGNPENAILPLEHFSTACKNIRIILQHSVQVESNVKIILQDEEMLRKDIIKSDLSSELMQQATKAFIENVSKLRVVAAGTDTIKMDAEKKFKEFVKASQGFFTNEEN